MILRRQHPALFLETMLPALDELTFQKFNSVPRQYRNFFNVKSSTRDIEQSSAMSGLGLLKQRDEAESTTYDEPVKGFDKTYRHEQFTLGFRVSKILAMNDKYSIISKMAGDLGTSARETVEVIAANYVNTNPIGPDGSNLFATDHRLYKSGGVQSNRLGATSDLAVTSLQLALTGFRKQKDPSGRKIRIRPDSLVVPAELEFVASEVLGGTMRSDTASNTPNAFRNRDDHSGFTKYKVWDYLEDPLKWYIWGSTSDIDLRFYWREKPNTSHDVDFDTRSMKTAIWMQCSLGHSSFEGVYGGF
jgi:phage major head subunit gpT-like protein